MNWFKGIFYFDRPTEGPAIVGDIRIDNQSQLFGPIGDEATVLKAYEKWGEYCAEHLIGDFSFAIWDKNKRSLFCARDHFGVKPFYYAQSAGKFIFSSQIQGIFNSAALSRDRDEQSIGNFLLWNDEDRDNTFYRAVKKLPAASWMKVDASGIKIQKYWSLDPARETRLGSNEEYAERFRELFTEAVRCRLRSEKTVGCLLSGGLDSSSITAVARDLLMRGVGGPASPAGRRHGVPLHTFSSVYEDVPSSDESAYIRQVTALEGIKPHTVHGDRIALFDGSRDLFKHLEEPTTHEISMYWNGIYPEAQRLGVGVLLDGDGGDEVVFRGTLRLSELLRGLRFVEYAKTLKALSKNLDRSIGDLFISQSVRPLVPRAALCAWRFLRWGNRALWMDARLLNSDFARKINFKNRQNDQIKLETSPSQSVRQQHFRELSSASVSNTFEVMSRSSGAFGMEHRFPFHDVRLAEYCLSLPSDQKLYRGWTKAVMRRAMNGILPDAVAWRAGKTYSQDDLAYRMTRYEKNTLESVILRKASRLEAYYDMGVLKEYYERFLLTGRYEFAIMLWQAVQFSQWLKRFETETNDEHQRKSPFKEALSNA